MKPKTVLVLTHCYPRWQEDCPGNFIHCANKHLTKIGFNMVVLAPHQNLTYPYLPFVSAIPRKESMDRVKIYRFRQWGIAYEPQQETVGKRLIPTVLYGLFMLSFLLKGLYLMCKEKPDVIHAHWWIPAGVIGFVLSTLSKKPLVIHIHGTDIRILDKSRFLVWLMNVITRKAKALIFVSTFLRDKFLRFTQPSLREVLTSELNGQTRVYVIPMPVNTEKIHLIK